SFQTMLLNAQSLSFFTVAPLSVLVALALDRALGEPPARWHPVVGMGHYLNFMGRRVAPTLFPASTGTQSARAFVLGALAWCLGAMAVITIALLLHAVMASWPVWAQALALGVLLKPTLSWRMLR